MRLTPSTLGPKILMKTLFSAIFGKLLHFIIDGREPKLFDFKSSSQQQSWSAHKIGQLCHQDQPSTCLCSNHILVEKNSNRSDISLCPRAPWSMSLCSLLPTVPSTTNPHLLYVARHVNSINNSHFNHHHQSILRPLKKILTKMIHPNVSDLPGLLLQVVLAVHGLVDHQLTCTKCGHQTC